MIRAYNEMYLDDAMRNLGEAVDYAANCCNINPDTFMEMEQRKQKCSTPALKSS